MRTTFERVENPLVLRWSDFEHHATAVTAVARLISAECGRAIKVSGAVKDQTGRRPAAEIRGAKRWNSTVATGAGR
jgi:hypothetical protein